MPFIQWHRRLFASPGKVTQQSQILRGNYNNDSQTPFNSGSFPAPCAGTVHLFFFNCINLWGLRMSKSDCGSQFSPSDQWVLIITLRWSDVATVPSERSSRPTPDDWTYIQLRNMNQKGLTEGKDSPQSRGTSWRWSRYKRSEEFRHVPKISPGTLGLLGPGWDCGVSVTMD